MSRLCSLHLGHIRDFYLSPHLLLPKELCTLSLSAMLFLSSLPSVNSQVSFRSQLQASMLKQIFLELFHSIKCSYSRISEDHITLLCICINLHYALICVIINLGFLHHESKDLFLLDAMSTGYLVHVAEWIDIAETFVAVKHALIFHTIFFLGFPSTIFYFPPGCLNFLLYIENYRYLILTSRILTNIYILLR